MMTPCARGAVKAPEPSRGTFISAGWKPNNVGNVQRMECADQPASQSAALRDREEHLGALMARMAQGDQSALAELYDETNILVYSLALRILHDQYAAEDVTIEVFTQVYQRAAQYDRSRGAPSAWLIILTRSRAIDRLRAEMTRREREEALAETATIMTSVDGPEACSATTELRRIVQHALALLTPEQREVIEIAYYTGLSHGEIAAKLGQPLGTVKTRIRTGMMLLREQLRSVLAETQP